MARVNTICTKFASQLDLWQLSAQFETSEKFVFCPLKGKWLNWFGLFVWKAVSLDAWNSLFDKEGPLVMATFYNYEVHHVYQQ